MRPQGTDGSDFKDRQVTFSLLVRQPGPPASSTVAHYRQNHPQVLADRYPRMVTARANLRKLFLINLM